MPEHLYTIESTGRGFYKEKGSKFISLAYQVNDEYDIKEILDELKKEYHDARHHCYAWVLGANGEKIRANDDGEPSNSAGKPILAQITSRGLTRVLVVVIRYFGGTLLGVGGLINAYKTASREALENARIVKEYFYSVYEVKFGYPDMNKVMTVLKELNAEQFEQEFEISCNLKAKVKKSDKEKFESAFSPFPEIEIKLIRED